ncbi:MAG: hypothetical protein JSS14_02335 [Proteobacteria bacterium]|nr:hypothetical protein [Pseudomonadota bacterium]
MVYKTGIAFAGSEKLPNIEENDVGPIGNRVGERDPRGMYGEHQSEPTNILGERAKDTRLRPEDGGGAGQVPANQLPNRASFELPADRRYVERGPFGVLAPGQVPDRNLILGENTMGHHLGSDRRPGAGLMDHEAERALGLGAYVAPMHPPEKVRRERFDNMLVAYDQFARSIEANLLELRALDPGRFDTQYAHLFKVNLPRSVPDPTLQPGFTTVEAAIQAKHSRSPAHGFRALTPEEVEQHREAARKPLEFKYVSPYSREALDRAAGRAPRNESAPKPWKDSK